MQNSSIEWTDCTFNPWEGCTKISPGCDNCYAENRNTRFKGGNWGAGAPRRRTGVANWRKPLHWNRLAGAGMFVQCDCGSREFRKFDNSLPPGGLSCCSALGCTALPESDCSPARPRVFCASLADWLDNEVPIEWLVDLLDLIRRTPNLDWLLLTKRIGNWRRRLDDADEILSSLPPDDGSPGDWHDTWNETSSMTDRWLNGSPPPNVWLGATVVNQAEADRDIPKLLATPAAVRFISAEPLLGEIYIDALSAINIDWIIAGGESGRKARPVHPDWIRKLRDMCEQDGTPFFFKQWGEWHPSNASDHPPGCSGKGGHWYIAVHTSGDVEYSPYEAFRHLREPGWQNMCKTGKKKSGRTLDGRIHDDFPECAP